jgi:integrase
MRSKKARSLQSRTVRIERESTKTDAGARIIPLNRDALAAVTELWHRAQVLGICEPDHYVFPACEYTHFKGEQTKDPTRHNFNPTRPIASWRSAWRSILKKAGIKNWHFHANRHQFVTKCGELGVEEEVLKSLVGHVDRKMLELYSHARLQAKRRAVEKLDEAAVTHPTDTEQSETAKTAVN